MEIINDEKLKKITEITGVKESQLNSIRLINYGDPTYQDLVTIIESDGRPDYGYLFDNALPILEAKLDGQLKSLKTVDEAKDFLATIDQLKQPNYSDNHTKDLLSRTRHKITIELEYMFNKIIESSKTINQIKEILSDPILKKEANDAYLQATKRYEELAYVNIDLINSEEELQDYLKSKNRNIAECASKRHLEIYIETLQEMTSTELVDFYCKMTKGTDLDDVVVERITDKFMIEIKNAKNEDDIRKLMDIYNPLHLGSLGYMFPSYDKIMSEVALKLLNIL